MMACHTHFLHYWPTGYKANINCLVQDCSNSIANALELLQSCTKGIEIGYPYETPLQLKSQEIVFFQNINFSSPIISTFYTEHINNTNLPHSQFHDWGTVSFEMFQMSFSGYPILQQATQLYKVLLCCKTPHGMLLGCLPSFELPSLFNDIFQSLQGANNTQ